MKVSLALGLLLASPPQANLKARLDAILSSALLDGATVSACVTRPDGTVVYARNPALRVVPASAQKTLTAIYALERLGPNFIPSTSFWKTEEGVMIDAPGNPTTTAAELEAARAALGLEPGTRAWIRQAYHPRIPPSWQFDDMPFRYAAPIAAFTVDRAAFELWASQGEVEPLPDWLGVRLSRGDTTGDRTVHYDPSRGRLIVNGVLPQERSRLERLAQPDALNTALAAMGLVLEGPASVLPESAPDHRLDGPPLAGTIKECLEKSDNILAEHLLLMAAGSESRLPLSGYPDAADRLRAFLTKEAGLRAADVRPADGSGLSRHNLITAQGMCRAIRWASRRPYGPFLKQALAQPGEGTLETRLTGIPFSGKTGTMDSTLALTGILEIGRQNHLIVCLVFNNTARPARDLRPIQDRFIVELSRGLRAHAVPANIPSSIHALQGTRPAHARGIS